MPTITLTTRRLGHAPVEVSERVAWEHGHVGWGTDRFGRMVSRQSRRPSRYLTSIEAARVARRLLRHHEANPTACATLPEDIARAVQRDEETYTARHRGVTAHTLTWDAREPTTPE